MPPLDLGFYARPGGIIRDHLPAGAEFVYGDPISSVDDKGETVVVTLTSGPTLAAYLLVIAEGVRSGIRDLVFGDQVTKKELLFYMGG